MTETSEGPGPRGEAGADEERPSSTSDTGWRRLFRRGGARALEEVNARLRAEVEERHRVERRLLLKDEVVRLLADADDLETVAPRILAAIGRRLHWPFGALWMTDGGEALRTAAVWADDEVALEPMVQDARTRRFAPGEGLPGIAFEEGKPRWIPDLAEEGRWPRAAVARESGLRAAVAFPLLGKHGALGVFEFFARSRLDRDPDLVTMFRVVATHIAQFVERTRAEAALRESEERTRTIVETALDAVIAADDAGRILEWNPQAERLLGWTREEAIGRSFVETVVPERHRPTVAAAFLGHRATDPAFVPAGQRFEAEALHRDGREIPVEVAIAPSSRDGHVLSAFLRDLTERNALLDLRAKSEALDADRRRLEEASRLRNAFLANMSHELRTPMNAIIGFAEIMHDGRVGPIADAHREYLGDILASARHLLRLINDMLDLAKIEAGKIEVRAEPVDVRAVAEEVRDVLRGLADRKRIRLSVVVDKGAASVVTDRAKLAQVLYNYLSNALKFTPEGGRVDLRVHPEGANAFRVEVKDTGVGIRPEDQGRLFVEFEQLEQEGGVKAAGTGLGLALTRRLVEAQGGSVGVASEPGRGSVFHAVLPARASSRRGGTPRRGE
jgi:PAS domain S-box-containing protein